MPDNSQSCYFVYSCAYFYVSVMRNIVISLLMCLLFLHY